ncbi:family 43 glycosylhydrolase [Flagellimonas meridianipacifica]|uniref:Glycosyl hydrolase family 43 n=1 Tax=Flagellimonas meridianipacifica TaxID=1080225 RepID=A0A2T0M8Q0_9FLAO|nr:family 43 glycosylhydrolase [Allomuricauda pacifica]PRX53802.1 glycosyl hydrolase family 43 [Allomuricauda pacifica]
MKALSRNVFLAFLCFYPLFLIGQKITVDNALPRLDEKNQIVDAHDGRVIQFGDTFYWYGTAYENTNGFTPQNHYRCYSSKDLMNWKYEGKLLEDQPEGVYYRPHVIYNRSTKKYLLWYNWYPKLWEGQFGVAISDTPQGPFKIVNENVQMHNSEIGLGDFGLFVDDDETGYISYNTIKNHQVSVEKLSDDYLSSTFENGGTISKHMEAGTMFKKDGYYYLLTDYTCCFCNYGSGARVYISKNPLKGYTLTTNINRNPGRYTNLLNDGLTRGTLYETLIKNEDNADAIEVNFDKKQNIDKVTLHIFTGNRPENCGDVSNPRVHPEIKTSEFNVFVWAYDQWEKIDIENQNVSKSALKERIQLEFKPRLSNRFKIIPAESEMNMYVNEVELFHGEVPKNSEGHFFITGPKIPQKPIIPAQQSYVMKLDTAEGEKFIWMGDLWGSASDNIKGHDYQYWSAPLQFNTDGTIKSMQWTDSWFVELKK